MEILLEQTSIKNNLQKVGFEIAAGKVETTYFKGDLSLIGFIPHNIYKNKLQFSINVNLNEDLIVTPYLVRFSNNRFPIPVFKKVESAEGKNYRIDNDLLIDTRLDEIPNSYLSQLLNSHTVPLPVPGSTFIKYIKSYIYKKEYIKKYDNDSYDYIGQKGELLLSDSYLDVTCVTNDFVCLCFYKNEVTGKLSYVVLPSNDLIRTKAINPKNFE